MRRIIERKVTVVTTTTWTISWQEDPPPFSSEADSAPPAEILSQAAHIAPEFRSMIPTKEADPPRQENPIESNTDESSRSFNSINDERK